MFYGKRIGGTRNRNQDLANEILRTELNAFLFAPQSHHHRRQCEHHECGQSHGVGVAGMLRENRLHVSDRAGEKHATLVSESGKESPHRVGRQFREMRRNDTPCTMNWIRKAPTTSNARVGAYAHSGTNATAQMSAVIIARRRPKRSDKKPNSRPPRSAPTMEIAVITARLVGPIPHWRWRKVGNISCVPCEAKFIIIIKRVK